MTKCYEISVKGFILVEKIVKKHNLPQGIKKSQKKSLKAVQNYLKFSKKIKIIYSLSESDFFGEFFVTKKGKKVIVLYLKNIRSSEDPHKQFIRTLIHEYIHFYFYSKKVRSAISLEEEENIISNLEDIIWQKYFS